MNDYKPLDNTEQFQWTDYTKDKSMRDYITPGERRGYRLTVYEQQAIMDSLICLGLLVFVVWVFLDK